MNPAQPSLMHGIQQRAAYADGINERRENGLLVLSGAASTPRRRILFTNSYGGSELWEKVKAGLMPPHHLWGCLELARMGYEVGIADPLRHFYLYRRPFPHDLKFWRFTNDWLGRDGILFSGHTLLYWLPLLKAAGLIKCPIVSLTYAREELDFADAHTGIIALTPAAAETARQRAPRAQVAHLSWGCDLNFFPRLPYDPQWFLSCGITHRDISTLNAACHRCNTPVRLICAGMPGAASWPSNVTLIDSGRGWNYQHKEVSYDALIHVHYASSIASLIVLKNDPGQYTAVGFTNLLEAMALARPVIVTRTGALPTEIDVEAAGCGLHVPPEDPAALARVLHELAAEPERAKKMGDRGRRLAESHYNIERFGRQLHAFFERF